MFIFILCFCSVLCLLYLCARLFMCALWSPAGKGLTSWLWFEVLLWVCHFPIGILGQVWYLIVSIPDLCTLTYFSYGVYISQVIRFARVSSNVDDFNNGNLFLTANLLKQGYRYHKIRKIFSKFYHRHSEFIVKYNIGLKTLLQQGISKPIFYGDLVYKFKRIVGKPNFSDQFKKIVKRYIRVGYNLDIMRQSACLVLNPITVYSYGFLFNCTIVGHASDFVTALT